VSRKPAWPFLLTITSITYTREVINKERYASIDAEARPLYLKKHGKVGTGVRFSARAKQRQIMPNVRPLGLAIVVLAKVMAAKSVELIPTFGETPP
jgi:hypothetical protein